MNANLTEIICVVDMSSSMNEIVDEAIDGFNQFLKTQKEAPGLADFTLVTFNSYEQQKTIHDGVNIQSVEPLTEKTFVPCGMTALLDAIGSIIDSVGKRLAATPENLRPGKVIMMILTDGQENASCDYTSDAIKEKVSVQENEFSWNFVFLSSDLSSVENSSQLGFNSLNTMRFGKGGSSANQMFTAYYQDMKLYRSAPAGASLNTKCMAKISNETSDEDMKG